MKAQSVIVTLIVVVSLVLQCEAPAELSALAECEQIRRGKEWINIDLKAIDAQTSRAVVPPREFYEVVASELGYALNFLEENTVVSLSREQATVFAGHHFQCEAGKMPYLIRAVYFSESPYHVSTFEDTVLVQQGSPGSAHLVFRKSAIVVNLSSTPVKAYVFLHVYDDL